MKNEQHFGKPLILAVMNKIPRNIQVACLFCYKWLYFRL